MATLALKTDTSHLLFQSGRIETLLGPAGSGKSALLRALAGLEGHPRARAFAGGVEITHLRPAERRVRYVPPGGVAYPRLDVLANLALALPRRDAQARARAAAERFDLVDVLRERVDALDAGTRQCIGLAKAWASGWGAVLLDEPFAVFDSARRRRVREQVRAAFVGRDRILVIAASSSESVVPLGGNVHVLHESSVLQRASVAEVLARPVDERTARMVHGRWLAVWPVLLVRDATLGPLVQLGDNLAAPAPVAWGELPSGAYRLGLPAHRVHFERRSAADIELRGEVVNTEVEGAETAVFVRTGGREFVVREAGCVRRLTGRSVTAYFALADALVFTVRGRSLRAPQRDTVGHGSR